MKTDNIYEVRFGKNGYEVWDTTTSQIMQGQLSCLEAYRYAKFLNVNGSK
jgi:hypothetical protein